VISSDGNELYEVKNPHLDTSLRHFTCSCYDFERRKRWCKHILPVTMYQRKQDQELPDTAEAGKVSIIENGSSGSHDGHAAADVGSAMSSGQ